MAMALLPEVEARHRVRVAVNAPVVGCFDYAANKPVEPGARVKVRFGFQGSMVGVVTERVSSDEPLPAGVKQLKPVSSVLDRGELIPADVRAMVEFAARYYHHPIGEVYATSMPSRLRKGEQAKLIKIHGWTITDKGREAFAEGPKGNALRRHELLTLLNDGQTLTRDDFIGLEKGWREVLRRMKRAGLVTVEELTSTQHRGTVEVPSFDLTPEQDDAVGVIENMLGSFRAALLDGVTGSGKTEVYIRTSQAALAAGKQVLVLVPEIGLTPQTVRRFQSRFNAEVVVLHSGLTDKERADAWLRAKEGLASVVVGTRSAIWTPMPNLGLIVVDEEHDKSFKQMEGGCPYNARDLAVWRAKQRNVPVILGSATPSLETMRHALDGNYFHLKLPHRTGSAGVPEVSIVDMTSVKGALHPGALQEIKETLERGEQALIFLNRRGYAPVLMCGECGECHECPQCDHRMTVHERRGRLECHWCGNFETIPPRCRSCDSPALVRVGHGTERLDERLGGRFSDYPVIRIDSDTVRHRGAMDEKLAVARSGQPCLLIGTQMLTKGHDFPNLTLVVVVDVDGSLFSAEIRAQETLAQTLVQVSGRAGRRDKPGRVLVQTRVPGHALLGSALHKGYHAALDEIDQDRREASMPPYCHMAVVRYSSPDPVECDRFGVAAMEAARPPRNVGVAGPVSGLRKKVGGRWQFYFVVESRNRPMMHRFLSEWVSKLSRMRRKRGLRWSVDVDPYELG